MLSCTLREFQFQVSRGDLNLGLKDPTSKRRDSREQRLGIRAFSLLGAGRGIKSFHKYTASLPTRERSTQGWGHRTKVGVARTGKGVFPRVNPAPNRGSQAFLGAGQEMPEPANSGVLVGASVSSSVRWGVCSTKVANS